ncbi:MAG: cation transporter [Halobacteriovoraceae bacterium]|nr:cation transporter [Halobacteriovoraceae bacterium]MBG59480.1 cation transporter [Peredibacter sp.]MBI99748.1 cation transporter [Halobacteriovoraceae bacterium]|tara:strand:- start:1679 stop:2554 length:876 start_codon:yes stop_codon:yes gene_type:complete
MGHNHSHDTAEKNIKIAFFLNVGFTILEFIGGYFVNSVAIISDALHDLGDSFSLGVAWYLGKKSKKEASETFSFGYTRFSLLGALVNSLVLIGGSIYVISEAIGRILEPEHSDAGGMILFAILGVAVNGYASWKVSKGKSLNERVVSWHLLEDVLGWTAILIVAIILKFKDIHYLDPALALFITAYILWNVVKRLKETLSIFLQGVPEDFSIEGMEQKLIGIQNIEEVHHTHIWSLDGEHHVLTTHLVLSNIHNFNEFLEVKKEVKKLLSGYKFKHSTVETEFDSKTCSMS